MTDKILWLSEVMTDYYGEGFSERFPVFRQSDSSLGMVAYYLRNTLEGDYSGCSLGLVDIKTKIAFQYMLLLLKRNFSFNINNT